MDDRSERVILVDENDRETGTAAKLDAHRIGLRHRALSVILRDPGGRVLLQKRALGKYHSGGLWTNTCCSHPRPGEPVAIAAARRLREEMGMDCALAPLMVVTYRAAVGSGLIEDELVHVFAGLFAAEVRPDPREADGYAWVDPDELRRDLERAPERHSVWFRKYCAEHWERMMDPAVWTGLEARAA